MRIRHAAFALMAIILAGCEESQLGSVQTVPGLASDVGGKSVVVQEADHCFITSVDSVDVELEDSDEQEGDWPSTTDYRQFQLRPGFHTLEVKYFRLQGRGFVKARPVKIQCLMIADHTYSLKAEVSSHALPFLQASFEARLIDAGK